MPIMAGGRGRARPVQRFASGRIELDFRDSWRFNIAAYEMAKLVGLEQGRRHRAVLTRARPDHCVSGMPAFQSVTSTSGRRPSSPNVFTTNRCPSGSTS